MMSIIGRFNNYVEAFSRSLFFGQLPGFAQGYAGQAMLRLWNHAVQFLYLLLITLNLSACDLSIRTLNYQGEQVSRVAAGVPFQLHIISKGSCEIDKLEFASSFEACRLSSIGDMKSINNVNGVVSRSSVHRYLGRIDQPGIYQLGQIKAWQGLNLVGSIELQLDVYEPEDVATDDFKSPVLELKTSSVSPYVGEQFMLDVRLYFTGNQIVSPQLTMPAGLEEQFELELKNGPTKEAQQRNGVMLDCWQWQILASAKKSGQFVVPAVSASFEKIDRQNSFFRFINQGQITLFSNIVKLAVRDLPKESSGALAIGHFTDFVATIDHTELSANQAAQIKLVLFGRGNWSKIIIKELVGLPANLQAYAGKTISGDNFKQFEFVLQGVQAGSCVIPAQAFSYFDSELNQYQNIYTKPINLTVLDVNQEQINLINPNKTDLKLKLDDSVAPIFESGEIKYHKNYYLPIHLWLALSFGLILVFLLKILDRKKKINKKHLCLLGLLFSSNLVANLEEKFLQANQLYHAGDFAKAEQLYESINFAQGRGAIVWYNLGNCYFQQNNFVIAITAWLQAAKIGNLRVVNSALANILTAQANLDINQAANYLPNFWVRSLILYDNFLSLQLLFLLILSMLLFFLIKWPNYTKLLCSLVVLLTGLILGIAILCAKENNLSYAVVQNNSKLFAGPGHQYHDLIGVPPGKIFKIVQESKDWCQVESGYGLQGGWLLKQDLRIV